MSQYETEREGNKEVRCPFCGEISKVKNWRSTPQRSYVICPKCQSSVGRGKFNSLQHGILAYAQKSAKPVKPCKCHECEAPDCDAAKDAHRCLLERET